MADLLDKYLSVNVIIISIFGVSIFAIFSKSINRVIKFIKRFEDNDKIHRKALLALLHGELFTKCDVYIKRGSITRFELNDLEYVFESYKNLGGNGTGEELYKRVKNLPIKSKEFSW